MRGKIDNPEYEARVLKLLAEAGRGVSIDYVAYNLGVTWSTARGLLLNMALKGLIKALKTTKSYVFLPSEAPAEGRYRGRGGERK